MRRDTEDSTRRDLESWTRGDSISVGGLTVKPKRDLPPNVSHGWNVCKGGCNVLPGATWGKSRDEALFLLHAYVAAGEDSDVGGVKFWALVRAIQYATGELYTI